MSEYSIALEKQLELRRFYESPLGAEAVEASYRPNGDSSLELRYADVAHPRRAPIATGAAALLTLVQQSLSHGNHFYWGEALCDLAEFAARDMPNWTLLEDALPQGGGFFWLAKPFYTDYGHAQVRAFSWIRTFDPEKDRYGLSIVTWADIGHEVLRGLPFPLNRIIWPFGQSRDEILQHVRDINAGGSERADKLGGLYRFLSAMIELMNQTLHTRSQRASRSAARRALRMGWVEEPIIRVVLLRRHVTEGHPEVGAGREYAHQWVVRGHWRQQWYPSLNRHQPKWIATYVKGPDDAPLKQPRATVFAVVR